MKARLLLVNYCLNMQPKSHGLPQIREFMLKFPQKCCKTNVCKKYLQNIMIFILATFFHNNDGLRLKRLVKTAPCGIRIRVTAVRGRCPRPLDEGSFGVFLRYFTQKI